MSEATARTVIDLRQQSAAGATGAQAGGTSPSTPPRAHRAAAEPKAAAVPSATALDSLSRPGQFAPAITAR
jgi:hypothetical protein